MTGRTGEHLRLQIQKETFTIQPAFSYVDKTGRRVFRAEINIYETGQREVVGY